MATGRVVVSTAVPDVVRNFGSVVRSPALPSSSFLCQQALEQPIPRPSRAGNGPRTFLDSIVAQLENHLSEALRKMPHQAMYEYQRFSHRATRQGGSVWFLIVGAGYAGSVLASVSPAAQAKTSCSWIAALISAATLTSLRWTPASWSIKSARTFSNELPEVSITCPAYRLAPVPAQGPGQRGWPVGPHPDQFSIRSTSSNGLSLNSFQMEEFLAAAPSRRSRCAPRDVVVSKVGASCTKIFPRLHAQAMGPGSVGPGRASHRARAHPNQSG